MTLESGGSGEVPQASDIPKSDQAAQEKRDRRNAYKRQLYQRDPKSQRQAMRTWQTAHPEQVRALNQQWQERNPEKHRKIALKSYHKHKEQINARRCEDRRRKKEAKEVRETVIFPGPSS
jgi:hypothetical protein